MLSERFREGFSEYKDPLTGLSIKGSDPLLEWINDPNTLRMFYVGQLGLCRERPTRNLWSRGEHAVSGAIIAREISGENGFPESDQMLAAVMMLYHDPHPAGGDGVKNFLGIDEAGVAENYWFSGNAGIRFSQRCESLGWNPEETKEEILLMISRKSEHPLSKLVHHPRKSVADIDFVSYTLADLSYGSIFPRVINDPEWRRCATKRHPTDCIVSRDLVAAGVKIARILEGGEFGVFPGTPSYSFSYEDFNPVGRMRWDEATKEWVFTDTEVLSHIIVASAVLHRALYFHPGMQAPELRLGQEAKKLGVIEELGAAAMSLDDNGLAEFLKKCGLDYWVSPEAHDGWTYIDPSLRSKDLKTYSLNLPRFNLRLDTLTIVSGKTMSFRNARPDVVEFADAIIRDLSGRQVLLADFNDEKRPRPD